MDDWALDLDFLLTAPGVRNTARWINEVLDLSGRRQRLAWVGIFLILAALGLTAVGVVLFVLAVLGWLPPVLPAVVLAAALGFYLGDKFYCRRVMAKFGEQAGRLHREKEEKLTAIGLLRFEDLPGFQLVMAQGKGSFQAWHWGTGAELIVALAPKLSGRLLRTEVPAAVCSHSRFAVVAAGHVANELAGLVDEREAISLPPAVFEDITLTAWMLGCPPAQKS